LRRRTKWFLTAFHISEFLHNANSLRRSRPALILIFMARPDCPLCSGTGWKTVQRPADSNENPNVQVFANEKPGSFAQGAPKLVWAVPCDCTIEDRASRIFTRARIPERYRHCDFDNFEIDSEYLIGTPGEIAAWNRSLEQARLVVQAFTRDYPAGTEHGLLLMGSCGVGKTHLAVAALQELSRRGHACLFYDYRELLKEIQDSYNAESDSTELGVLDPVVKVEILLLDDLGASKPSHWALETIGHILNARYNDNRVTLITTNYIDSDANPRPVTRPSPLRPAAIEETLADRVGVRIRSRLYEMCRTIELAAPDYRKEIRQASRFRA
jgi:DNA replication protein DnaC